MPDGAPARRTLAVVAAVAMVAAACGPSPSPSPSPTVPGRSEGPSAAPSPSPSSAPQPQAGGTIYVLSQNEQLDQIDPQRIYTPEDLAFLGGTIYRSLEAFSYSADPIDGTRLVPDLATDLGTPSDGGRTWAFTLRDRVTFQDGSPIRCEDVRYGVSRTFATDVINQGPTYAIQYLDIPSNDDGTSTYPGPFAATRPQQAMFDAAVTCSADHRTITFHLKRAIGDFNYATALGMSPVPKAADTGETYGTTPESLPVSSGPYEVESYTTGSSGKLVLVRNEAWNRDSDPIRPAYPDRWEVDFGIDPNVIDQRLMASSGSDTFALGYGQMRPENLAAVFSDAQTPTAQFAGRAVSGSDPYVRFFSIDITRVPSLEVRQAMLVALDRAAIRTIRGGAFSGDYADGVLKPTIGIDYAPTEIWDTFFGQTIPSHGDPALARKLLADAAEPTPNVTFSYPDTSINKAVASVVVNSLGKAGIVVEAKPICAGYGCGIFLDKGAVQSSGWGADWPNASTVIPTLFTQRGGWDLSQVDDPAFNAAVEDALQTTDRQAQAAKWQALNRQAVEQAWVIPTFFGLSQTLAGTGVGPIYRWPAYSSWPYGVMYVTR